MSSSVEDEDHGWDAIFASIESMDGVEIEAGIREPEAGRRPARKEGEKPGPTVGQYARFNEFGTAKMPARPFMSRYFDQQERMLAHRLVQASLMALDGKNPAAHFHVTGQMMRDGIREKIDSREWTANAPSTVARKGSDNPLIDKGLMKQSVTGVVLNKKAST